MVFEPTPLAGAWILDLERRADERGYFARAWCRRELEERGLIADMAQANLSYTARQATIRGLHYQIAPCEETKIVRCTRGAIWDVIIDLRPESPTYLRWFGLELTAESSRQLYVPAACAHGYQTLVNDTEVSYFVSEYYAPRSERGIRWNDSRFSIVWPASGAAEVSPKDQAWPDFHPQPLRDAIASVRGGHS